jgi:DNA-binding CsgD family transcriptional regulator
MLTTDQSANPSHEVSSKLGAAEHTELCQLWSDLLTGQARILTAGTTADCHYFEIGPSPHARAARTLGASRNGWLMRALLGEAQKVIQADAAVSASTIATQLGNTLEALGLPRRSHRTPLLLVLLAHVVHGQLPAQHLHIMRRSTPTGDGWLVWSGRPELVLASQLSPGEVDVLLQLVAGQTYSEICRNRRTSPRTVANQIAAIYSKLKLSGRAQLLCYLAVVSGLNCSAPRHSRAASENDIVAKRVGASSELTARWLERSAGA